MPRIKEWDYSVISDIDVSYLAGFVDGEGCFFIGHYLTNSFGTNNKYYNYHSLLKISNNSTDTLDWIHKVFGGRYTIYNKLRKDKTRNFITYEVYFTGNNLTDLCHRLLPFLKTKRLQALNMIEMRSTYNRSGSRGPCRPSQEIQDKRKECHILMHRLNSRFKDHPLKKDLY